MRARPVARALKRSAFGMRSLSGSPDFTWVNVEDKRPDGLYLVRKDHWPANKQIAVPSVPPWADIPYPRRMRMWFEDASTQRPFLLWLKVDSADKQAVQQLPALLTQWRRLGVTQSYRFFQGGVDENGDSFLDISLFSAAEPVTGSIVRVKNAQIIYADGEEVKTLDTSDNTTEAADVGGEIVGLDIGEVTGDTTSLIYTEQAVVTPLGCQEAYTAGYEHGKDVDEEEFFLYNDGAFDCSNGDGYAWEDFLYEEQILAGEDDEESFYYWTIPGDILFDHPDDADCYREGFVEACRETYDLGNTDEGCGSGGGEP